MSDDESKATPSSSQYDEEFWRQFLTEGGDTMKTIGRRLFTRLPADLRCRMCAAPFEGPGARVMRLIGKRQSDKNPSWCSSCTDFMSKHHGGAEVEGAMPLPISAAPPLAERMSSGEYHALLDRFFATATKVVFEHDGYVDKFMGDDLVALFFPLLTGERDVARTIEAARSLLVATGHANADGPWVPVGAGIHAGRAGFGVVGQGSHVELTAVGDAVNVAARLASRAEIGEVLVSADAATEGDLDPGLERRALELKGRREVTEAVSLRVEAPPLS